MNADGLIVLKYPSLLLVVTDLDDRKREMSLAGIP